MIASCIPVMIVTGPIGVGKTSVASEVSALLERANAPHAFMEIDSVHSCYPRPPHDPFNNLLAMRNLTAVWTNFREAGAERLVIADVVESRDDLEPYGAAVAGAEVLVVRLTASLHTLADRVRQREIGSGLDWHLRHAAELAELFDRNQVEDILVDTEGKTVTEIAQEILTRSRWLDMPTSARL